MARKMKDSGVEWIGEIPEGWSKNKCLRIFKTIGSGTTPKNLDSIAPPSINWIQSGDINGSFLSSCKNVISEDIFSQCSALKIYSAPFIIIAMYGASVGNISISLINGCVNQACCVLSFPSCNLDYTFYALKSAQAYLVQKAVGGGQPNISQDIIKQLWIPQPSLPIQETIVNYLNITCFHIDSLLAKTLTSIEEYKKLKQAVITQAVTKGVRGEREMKESGVEWIGEIPREWDLIKSSRIILSTQNGLTRRDLEKSDGQIVLKLKNITSDGKIDYTYQNRITLAPKELDTYTLSSGDFLFVRVNGSKTLVGKCAIFDCIGEPVAYNDHIIRVKLSKYCYNKFFFWYLYSTCGKAEIDLHTSTAAGQYTISGDGLRDINLIFPPLYEQQEIADYLDAKCTEIDRLIAKKEQLVKELEIYKKSLIYEVVTGKREV